MHILLKQPKTNIYFANIFLNAKNLLKKTNKSAIQIKIQESDSELKILKLLYNSYHHIQAITLQSLL